MTRSRCGETGANTVKTGLDAAHSQARGAISCATNCLQRETLNPVHPIDNPPVMSPSLRPHDTSRLCFTLQKAHVAFSPLASCGVRFIAPILSKVSACVGTSLGRAPRGGDAQRRADSGTAELEDAPRASGPRRLQDKGEEQVRGGGSSTLSPELRANNLDHVA